jgi:hypothetical protein
MVDSFDPNTEETTAIEKETPKLIWGAPVPETVQEPAEVAVEPKKTKRKKKAAKPLKPAKVKKPIKKAKAKKEATPLDDFGFRKGTIRSKAAAMYSSARGATIMEVKAKLGSVQYNMLLSLEQKGFKLIRKEIDGLGNRPATRFFLHAKKR